MFCLFSHCQRSAHSLALPCPHTTVRCHDARAFSATPTSQSGFRHAPPSWRMTRPVTVASSRKSLSAPSPDLVSHTFVRPTRLGRLHSAARLSKLAGSAIPNIYSYVRIFSSGAACGMMKAEDPNATAGIIGAEDASVQENGQNEVPLGMPTQDGSLDPESEEDVPLEPEELQDTLTRPPPVNSSYLPLPWNGRLGYVSFSICSCLLMFSQAIGLFEYLFTVLQSFGILLTNMPYRFNPRKPPSAARPVATTSPNQEPP